ncbi:hypothetical protein Bca52824_045233 [Brassica carinata]|uniref:Uncharacterized protein n=1 Tax=Brassica carinata TaxID=52824 RepID=A0A8X7UP35_BRACI|nr:hypothetical protein Bca52824_045233 [Brassica carinata]
MRSLQVASDYAQYEITPSIDGLSHQKVLKSYEIDGEVMSDAGMKVMRPVWREGSLTKDVHNIHGSERATEKIVSGVVQFKQGYVEKARYKPSFKSNATHTSVAWAQADGILVP